MRTCPAVAVIPFEPGYEMLALLELERWLVAHGCVDVEKFMIEKRHDSDVKDFVVYYKQETPS